MHLTVSGAYWKNNDIKNDEHYYLENFTSSWHTNKANTYENRLFNSIDTYLLPQTYAMNLSTPRVSALENYSPIVQVI